MKKLKTRDKRALLAGGVVAGAIFLYSAVTPVFEAQAEIASKTETQQRMLTRTLETLQKEGVFRAELQEIETELVQYYARLLESRDAASAVGELETTVRNMAGENNLRVIRSNPLQEAKMGDRYLKVTVQFTLEGDILDLTNFLYALSTYPKHLLVEDFMVANVRDRIQPRLNVSGYIRLS